MVDLRGKNPDQIFAEMSAEAAQQKEDRQREMYWSQTTRKLLDIIQRVSLELNKAVQGADQRQRELIEVDARIKFISEVIRNSGDNYEIDPKLLDKYVALALQPLDKKEPEAKVIKPKSKLILPK